jgi:hypothetical protein
MILGTAALCEVSHETIRRIEAGEITLKRKTVLKVRAAFEKVGIEFIAENSGGAGDRLEKPKSWVSGPRLKTS